MSLRFGLRGVKSFQLPGRARTIQPAGAEPSAASAWVGEGPIPLCHEGGRGCAGLCPQKASSRYANFGSQNGLDVSPLLNVEDDLRKALVQTEKYRKAAGEKVVCMQGRKNEV
jgi:hypothetical protein